MIDKNVFAHRRQQLCAGIQERFANASGALMIWGNIEDGAHRFRQESTFYYLTGICEPACVLYMDIQTGKTTLFVPNTSGVRARWMPEVYDADAQSAQRAGVDEIVYCGDAIAGYRLNPLFGAQYYQAVLEKILAVLDAGGRVFTCYPSAGDFYVNQVMLVDRICSWIAPLRAALVDISGIVAGMRRCKDRHEIELMYAAFEGTLVAHAAAVQVIKNAQGVAPVYERDVQAGIAYALTSGGYEEAFPSIVASGASTPFIHYAGSERKLEKSDLVIVDCGARHGGYCADITRTYPVSGIFSPRQQELYDMVLQAQEYVAALIKPGMWLNNAHVPEQSLHHLAVQFFAQQGYAQYFAHGIGHYLGLDVHDVGDLQTPLQVGDVITIEPGLYLHDEGIGVRIEDDYWVIKDGAHCLSEELPKEPAMLKELIAI